MKKNLLYFSINDTYVDCLNFNLKLLNKYEKNFDICLILPENIKDYYNKQYYTHIINDYNNFYTKIKILNYENYENYENFLYLDADAFIIDDINEIFETINFDKKHIHGVKEKLDINKDINDHYFRFSDKTYEYNDLFNYGTFGFNIEMTKSLKEFNLYIEKYINDAKIDQALYNEFFAGEKRNILPTLSKYVYLGEINNITYKNINQISYEQSKIIHFLGNYCNSDIKLKKAKLHLSKFL